MTLTVLIIQLSIDLLFLLAGVIFRILPPKKINSYFGFRTTSSMSTQINWDLAHSYSGKLLILTSLISICICLILYFITTIQISIFIGLSLTIKAIYILLVIILTERKLRRKNL